MTCLLCLERVPMDRIADHMRLLHPHLSWHGDDPSDARADAWANGSPVVYEDFETPADALSG